MHPNRVFHTQTEAEILAFSREQGFGTLTISTDLFPITSHVPFIITDNGSAVEFHMAANNPMRPLLAEARPVTLSIMGPHAYISPDWYQADDQVPTWNYVASVIYGHAKAQSKEWLPKHLERLSAEMENRLSPKTPWTMDKMDPKRLKAMQNGIFGVELKIESLDGTWKLGQNKPETARINAAESLSKFDQNSNNGTISKLMRGPVR